MKKTVINSISQLNLRKDKSVACIGFFDGIHKGHQALINKTKEISQEKNIASMLITFNPDPWAVVNNKSNVKHITPLKRKLEILEEYDIDEFVILNFNSSLMNLSPDDFVNRVLIALGLVDLVIGEDFRFGYRAQGNLEFLKENYSHSLTTHTIDILNSETNKVGSTLVSQSILNGNVDTAANLMGRLYRISGIVIHGAKMGRQLGFPTANLDIYDEYIIPKEGVYAGFTFVDDVRYQSIVNVGYNPTINSRENISVETHILDFNQEIYDKVIHQEFAFRIRDEIKFNNIEDLINQMKKDEIIARENLE